MREKTPTKIQDRHPLILLKVTYDSKKRGDINMKYKENWDYEGDSPKNTCKKHKKHEKHEDYRSCKDTCKEIRIINLWKLNSKH